MVPPIRIRPSSIDVASEAEAGSARVAGSLASMCPFTRAAAIQVTVETGRQASGEHHPARMKIARRGLDRLHPPSAGHDGVDRYAVATQGSLAGHAHQRPKRIHRRLTT